MAEEDNKSKIEEKYMMLQLIGSQMKELEKEISTIEEKSEDMINMKSQLSNLSELKLNSKSLAPFGLGLYVESEIKNTKQVLVNVGAGVLVKKSVGEARDLIGWQIKQTKDIAEKLTNNLAALATRAQEIENEAEELARE